MNNYRRQKSSPILYKRINEVMSLPLSNIEIMITAERLPLGQIPKREERHRRQKGKKERQKI
jgi:hypothetical protein